MTLQPVNWRQLAVGAKVFAPPGFAGTEWREAIVVNLGKNRGDRTVVKLVFTTTDPKQRSTYYASELCWRKPDAEGKEKP